MLRRNLYRASGYHVSIGAALAAALPTNALRCAAYRALGYEITDSRIGFGTLIDVESARITGCVVGPLNRFHGPFSLVMDHMEVGGLNEFTCGDWAPRWACYGRYCRLQRGSLITGNHLIDASGGFELGQNSWIGGRGSQIWTHVGDDDPENRDLAVTVADHCFIGAGVLIGPGSSLPSETTVSMGSTVTAKFGEARCLIGGVPAKVIQTGYDSPVRHELAPGDCPP
jgi:hypothetical protein